MMRRHAALDGPAEEAVKEVEGVTAPIHRLHHPFISLRSSTPTLIVGISG